MERILIKLIVAIAIGLIIGVAGSFEFKYYSMRPKEDISKKYYETHKDERYSHFIKEIEFNTNKRNAIFLTVASVVSIILLIPELKDKE
jgi:predicted negative regulator of RcsB-dependent stress response